MKKLIGLLTLLISSFFVTNVAFADEETGLTASVEFACKGVGGQPATIDSVVFAAYSGYDPFWDFDDFVAINFPGHTELKIENGLLCTNAAAKLNSVITKYCEKAATTKGWSWKSTVYSYQPALVPTSNGYRMQWNLMCVLED